MIVEIHGAGFHNKGAQLMLWTVLRKLASELPEVRCCVEPGPDQPYNEIAAYGLRLLFPMAPRERPRWFPLLFRMSRLAAPFVPNRVCERYGIVRRGAPDALIDISGYAFGDPWSAQRTRNVAMRAAYYRRHRKPVILLPQMFGPFDHPESATAFRRLLDETTLVFAREATSLAYARGVGGANAASIRLAPDITIFTDVSTPDESLDKRVRDPFVCLVPNIRITDQGKDQWGENYMERMAMVGRRVRQEGVGVLVMVHESRGGDMDLAEELIERIGCDASAIVVDADPLRLKAILSNARFVVASRYHSAVSALSSGVPTVTLGWAHKYDLLMKDFGVPELAHHAADSPDHLMELVDQLFEEQNRSQINATVVEAKRRMAVTNKAMWDEVLATLRSVSA